MTQQSDIVKMDYYRKVSSDCVDDSDSYFIAQKNKKTTTKQLQHLRTLRPNVQGNITGGYLDYSDF